MNQLINRILLKIRHTILRIKGMKIGKASVIAKGVDITCPERVSIGNFSAIYKNVSIFTGKNGQVSIGNHSHLSSYVYMLAENQKVIIGNSVGIAPFCSFFCSTNHYQGENSEFVHNYLKGDIVVGNNVVIGAQSVILPGTTIEDNVFIGANSLVKGYIKSNGVYAGSPLRKIRSLQTDGGSHV